MLLIAKQQPRDRILLPTGPCGPIELPASSGRRYLNTTQTSGIAFFQEIGLVFSEMTHQNDVEELRMTELLWGTYSGSEGDPKHLQDPQGDANVGLPNT